MFLFVLFLLTGCKGHDIHVCSTLKTEYPKKIECTDCSHDVSSGGIICTYILMHICVFFPYAGKMGEKSLSRLSVLWANCILKSNVKNLEGILMHGGMGKKKRLVRELGGPIFPFIL